MGFARKRRTTELSQLSALWTARVLVSTTPELYMVGSSVDDDIARTINNPKLATVATTRKVQTVARALVARLEKQLVARGMYRSNLAVVARSLRLDAFSADVLAVIVAAQRDRGLKTCLDADAHATLAAALEAPAARVRKALRPRAVLAATGFIKPMCVRRNTIEATDAIVSLLCDGRVTASEVVATFARRSARAKLTLADFGHLERDVNAMVALIRGALRRHAKGVHVLLHGAPGTGKTELARALAAAIRSPLYDVPDADDEDDAVPGSTRLGLAASAHRALGGRAILLFDEAEDVFPTEMTGFGLKTRSTQTKSWTHRLLETARVPTIWTTNSIRQIDRATLRRFDLIVELDVPPRATRRAIIAKELGRAAPSDTWLDRVAGDERVSPGHVARAARSARLMGAMTAREVERTIDHVLERNLAHVGERKREVISPCGEYDTSLVRASMDLETVASSLIGVESVSMCLHGPPGTGKTAFVAHLAKRLDRPLRAARASDLLDCYVGGTEQNIAELFRVARRNRELLFLDEADSVLRSRDGARALWEVTQVNEMLVQMENFDGIFVCATNQVEALDRASLRRFAMKIEFFSLTPTQRWSMFLRLVPNAPVELRTSLDRLDGLTPGDFATVARQLRLAKATSSDTIARLSRELAMHNLVARIGF